MLLLYFPFLFDVVKSICTWKLIAVFSSNFHVNLALFLCSSSFLVHCIINFNMPKKIFICHNPICPTRVFSGPYTSTKDSGFSTHLINNRACMDYFYNIESSNDDSSPDNYVVQPPVQDNNHGAKDVSGLYRSMAMKYCDEVQLSAVSYTHLTLPTILLV